MKPDIKLLFMTVFTFVELEFRIRQFLHFISDISFASSEALTSCFAVSLLLAARLVPAVSSTRVYGVDEQLYSRSKFFMTYSFHSDDVDFDCRVFQSHFLTTSIPLVA